ncbi:MAG: hypothetical protein ACOC5J_03240, partial [Gemmatimonadota bacterium]
MRTLQRTRQKDGVVPGVEPLVEHVFRRSSPPRRRDTLAALRPFLVSLVFLVLGVAAGPAEVGA